MDMRRKKNEVRQEETDKEKVQNEVRKEYKKPKWKTKQNKEHSFFYLLLKRRCHQPRLYGVERSDRLVNNELESFRREAAVA
jgi:hypothetical protein